MIPFNSKSSSIEIANALESKEEWKRNTSFRILLERKDPECVPTLKHLAIESKYAETRAQALWLLHLYNALDESIVKKSLDDKEAGVREQAVLLAAQLISGHQELADRLISAASDTSMRVRFNTALVLGDVEGPHVVDALASIAAKDGDDKWMRAAILSGIGTRLPEFLAKFHNQKNANPLAFAAVMQDLGRLFGNGASMAACRTFLKKMIQSDSGFDWRTSTVLGLAEGILSSARLYIRKGFPFALNSLMKGAIFLLPRMSGSGLCSCSMDQKEPYTLQICTGK
jgi:hypothetical protein